MSTDTPTGEYRIERLTKDNLADVEKLHVAIYGKMPGAGYFAKKYDTAFTAVTYTGYIAYNKQGLAIAFYGVIPCFIQFSNKIVLAAQSADTMTHPKYRQQGLFVELALLTFQLCRNVAIEFIFGFPNQNSLPGFINKLGWKSTEQMGCYIIPSCIFSWERLFGKLPLLKKSFARYQQMKLKRYLVDQNGIANSVFKDGFAGVYRDHHFRQYKTYTDTQVIKIGRSVLWIKIGNALVIGDMAVTPADFDRVMNHLKRLACKLGIKEIHFHTSPGTSLDNLFATRFHFIPSFQVIFKDLKGRTPVSKIKFTFADIDTF